MLALPYVMLELAPPFYQKMHDMLELKPFHPCCKSKVLPPCVLDIVGQDSRGTNNVFECKLLLRFLENKFGDKATRKI